MATPDVPGGMNPLWVISAFLGVAEVTVGVVATQSSGWIQGLLAIFAVGFPVGIAIAFFLILWLRPYVLYAPHDYPSGTQVADFVEAISVPQKSRLRSLDAVVRATMEEVLRDKLPEPAIEESVQAAIDIAHSNVDKALVFVDTGFPDDASTVSTLVAIPAFVNTTVQEFLDELWAWTLAAAVPPFTYGKAWDLVFAENCDPLREAGSQWAARHGVDGDSRLLSEVGIVPGVRLRVRLKRSSG